HAGIKQSRRDCSNWRAGYSTNRADCRRPVHWRFAWWSISDSSLRPGWQRRNNHPGSGNICCAGNGRPRGWLSSVSRPELYGTGDLVPLRERKKAGCENGTAQYVPRIICRYRSDSRIRNLKGWHENSAQCCFPKRNETGRAESNIALQLRRLRNQHAAEVRLYAPALVRSRRSLCGSEYSRGRRVRGRVG